MSQRTFIEINHDLFRAIEDRPHQFVSFLRSTVLHRDVGSGETLRQDFGVRRLDQHHHSDAVTIFVNGCVVFQEERSPHLLVPGDSLIERLRKLVFTAAHGWQRGIKLSREDRDRIVAALQRDGSK